MKKKFIEKISSGKYADAKNMLQDMAMKKKCNFLIDLAIETNLIGLYTFVCFLLIEQEDITIHTCAAAMLIHSMWEGANAAAYLHARRIAELDPGDLNNKQRLLFYFGIPDCIMSRTEAKQIAYEVLAQDPENVEAQETLALIIRTEKRETTGNEK